MLLLLEFAALVAIIAYWWYRNDREYYSKYPPGPLRLPFFGNIFQIAMKSKFPATAIQKLADIYGDVMFLKMGSKETVVFSTRETIREILNHESGTKRQNIEVVRDRHADKNLGIIWSWEKPWENLRRFTVRNLRDFGFGKSADLDTVINEELDKFLTYLRKEVLCKTNNIVDGEDFFGLTIVNVLWRHVSGVPYDYNDPKIKKLLKLNDDFANSTNFAMDISEVYPSLRDWFPNLTSRATVMKASNELYEYGRELLEEHRKTVRNLEDPQSFIEVFAAKVENSKNDPDTDFTEEQFIMTILDLLLAGSETSAKTLAFGLLHMLLYPEVQEKVQQEIDAVVPKGEPITCAMRNKLPYTAATVLEVFRYSTILPTPSPREATEDFYYKGYLIKKGTALMTLVQAVHFSEAVWGDPHVFRPERFLNTDKTAIVKKTADLLETFGGGRRICIGLQTADTSIFLYFSTILRHFKLSKLPGANLSLEPIIGMTLSPKPFKMKLTPREA